jgi:Ca2+-binding RTX toxin-like protein
MSKRLLILTIIGIAIITALLSTTTISLFGGILLSLPSSPVVNVWALNITGTQGDDTLDGTAEKDYIYGYGGNDIISGLEGGDRIRGGKGDDTIHGDQGNDRIRAGSGNDLIFGDDGNDVLIAGRGNDTLTGGPGKDTFNCGEGIDTVTDASTAENDNVTATCENTSSSSSPPPPSTTDDITKNPFNLPLDQGNGGAAADDGVKGENG